VPSLQARRVLLQDLIPAEYTYETARAALQQAAAARDFRAASRDFGTAAEDFSLGRDFRAVAERRVILPSASTLQRSSRPAGQDGASSKGDLRLDLRAEQGASASQSMDDCAGLKNRAASLPKGSASVAVFKDGALRRATTADGGAGGSSRTILAALRADGKHRKRPRSQQGGRELGSQDHRSKCCRYVVKI
jgi:hypothetical protein